MKLNRLATVSGTFSGSVSDPARTSALRRTSARVPLGLALAATFLSSLIVGCGGGGGGGSVGPVVGGANDNTPAAGLAVSGSLIWGRLVDVRAHNALGQPVTITVPGGGGVLDPRFLDVLIAENVGISKTLTSTVIPPVTLQLDTDPVSGASFLVIGALFSEASGSDFQRALAEVSTGLGNVAIAGPASVPPFTKVPRDASFKIVFDRELDPKTVGPDTVRVFVGVATGAGKLPPDTFMGRIIFKPSSPREIVIDPTISAIDSGRISEAIAAGNKTNPQPLPLNSQGLPPSLTTTTFNVAVFLPSKFDISKGVTKILLGKDGSALNTTASVTKFSSTVFGEGVVRAFRAGGAASDANQGFLTDPTPPRILGSQPVTITEIVSVDQRTIKVLYTQAACDLSVHVGDSIQQGPNFATIASIDPTSVGDADPSYTVTVSYLQSITFNTSDPAILTTPFETALSIKAGCFVVLQPLPAVVTDPLTGLDPSTRFTVRFSKPVDVSKVNPLENVVVVMDPVNAGKTPTTATNFDLAIGDVSASPDLKAITFTPKLPYRHDTQGVPELAAYLFYVVAGTDGITDLAGNAIAIDPLSFVVPFRLNPNAPANTTRGLSLRFDSLFETPGQPQQVVSGQVTQSTPGTIGPRPATHFARDADTSNVFIGVMPQFTQGVQTPLSALGSRLMTVWRHIDLNLSINAISDTDLDVEQLYWAPFAGLVLNDFFPRVRIDLAHSKFFPDEWVNPNNLLPAFPTSGLSNQSFGTNIFEAADHPEETVYDGLYVINPNAAFLVPSGATMMPFPIFSKTYTWRDSSYGARKFGGSGGVGVNPQQYFSVLFGTAAPAGVTAEHPYLSSAVPSVGLPLLLDYRIYPASDPNTKGLNGFQVAVAVNSSSKPNFRVYSTGGLDASGAAQTVTPDIAPAGVTPSGGFFPPGSTQGTPGNKTPPDGPEVYLGRADFATKISRVYTHFYNLGLTSPVFQAQNVVRIPTLTPANTSVVIGFRGADNATSGSLTDARCFDVYGDLYPAGTPPTIPQPPAGLTCGALTGLFPAASSASIVNFVDDISLLNTKRFLQMRYTFTNDIVNNVAPLLSAVGIAYSNP